MKCGDANNPGGVGLTEAGDPCGMHVIKGTFRCFMHGGNTPAAKHKAETAMALLRFPAIEMLYKVIRALESTIDQFLEDSCVTCGYPKGDAEEKDTLIRACRTAAQACASVLDRTGLGVKSTLEVKQSDGDLDPRQLTEDEKTRMIALLAQVRALKEEIRTRMHGSTYGVGASDATEQAPPQIH